MYLLPFGLCLVIVRVFFTFAFANVLFRRWWSRGPLAGGFGKSRDINVVLFRTSQFDVETNCGERLRRSGRRRRSWRMRAWSRLFRRLWFGSRARS